MARWQVWCDGTALPNPGDIGIGVVVVDPAGVRHELSKKSELRGCNNEAEGSALVAALEFALELGAGTGVGVDVVCDSSIVVEQTVGDKRTDVARLAVIFARARLLLARFDDVTVTNVPRRRNAEADALARKAVGLLPKVEQQRRRRRR